MFREKLAQEAARFRRRGWSEGKIGRAMEDRRKAHARPPRVSPPDSLDLWAITLRDLGKNLKLPRGACSSGWTAVTSKPRCSAHRAISFPGRSRCRMRSARSSPTSGRSIR
jgi:hypothetical protein